MSNLRHSQHIERVKNMATAFFKDAFRGKEKLGKTFLLGVIGFGILLYIDSIIGDAIDGFSAARWSWLWLFFILPYQFWLMVSIWRCSNNCDQLFASIPAKIFSIATFAMIIVALVRFPL